MQEMIRESHQTLTPAEWTRLCNEWEHSGEKQQVFCENRKINYTTFVYWRMRCKKAKEPVEQNVFSAVQIKPTDTTNNFKIHLPDGIVLTLPVTLDKESLKIIFELLGVSAC